MTLEQRQTPILPADSPRPPGPGPLARPDFPRGARAKAAEPGGRVRLMEDQPTTAEHLLQEAVRRALRKPAGRLAVVLHLSALTPPAPLAHHRRIARSVLEDAAQRHHGEVHSLGNGDLALLCHLPPQGDPTLFRAALQHLFQSEAMQPEALVSLWRLDREAAAVLAWVAERLAAASALPSLALPGLLSAGEATDRPWRAESENGAVPPGLQSIGPVAGLLRRQTAIRLEPWRGTRDGDPPSGRLRPLFREISLSMAALDRRVAAARQARTDPFLLRSLATELDELVLEAMLGELPAAAGLPPAAGEAPIRVHLNLSVAGILSNSFTRFADAGPMAAIEIQLIEVCADPVAFTAARARIAAAGFLLVLDGISPLALGLTAPEALRPDLVKLEWSPRLAQAPRPERDRIAAALAALSPDRVVLDHADTEAAMRWGLSHGLRNFQGEYADVLQATARLGACPAGNFCTMRQCGARAEAMDRATRAECGDHRMLDHGPAAGTAAP